MSSAIAVATVSPRAASRPPSRAGTATITATFCGVIGTAMLTVTAGTLTSIQVGPVDPTVGVDDDHQLHRDRHLLRRHARRSHRNGDLVQLGAGGG